MLVYRYLCEEELNQIIKGDIQNIGNEYWHTGVSNTHSYHKGTKYLHFLKRLEDLDEIRKIKRNEEGNFFICQFDISRIKLLLCGGNGYYEPQGYKVDYTQIREYAVPTKDIKKENLKLFIKDTQNKDMPLSQICSCFQNKKGCENMPKDELCQ